MIRGLRAAYLLNWGQCCLSYQFFCPLKCSFPPLAEQSLAASRGIKCCKPTSIAESGHLHQPRNFVVCKHEMTSVTARCLSLNIFSPHPAYQDSSFFLVVCSHYFIKVSRPDSYLCSSWHMRSIMVPHPGFHSNTSSSRFTIVTKCCLSLTSFVRKKSK